MCELGEAASSLRGWLQSCLMLCCVGKLLLLPLLVCSPLPGRFHICEDVVSLPCRAGHRLVIMVVPLLVVVGQCLGNFWWVWQCLPCISGRMHLLAVHTPCCSLMCRSQFGTVCRQRQSASCALRCLPLRQFHPCGEWLPRWVNPIPGSVVSRG